MVQNLGHALGEHQRSTIQQLATTLREYFDPQSGRFSERVERLVMQDGELELLLRRQVGLDGSELARTLASHVGEHSPLMRLLDPDASDGLLQSLSSAVEGTLAEQQERILREFSLDNSEGALARFVGELADRHGEVGQALESRIDLAVSEFSLDREDSALSRLVGRVEQAQRAISAEFSLDQEGSALARMRRELVGIIEAQRQVNERFQADVLQRLSEMTARREEAARSTRHGDDFEEAVAELIQLRSQRAGDVATRTGSTPGLIKYCKTGDIVVEIGVEQVAASARIVIEAKEDASYTLQRALGELEEARKNRGAEVGLFVFSARTASAGLEPFARYGSDIVLTWDADDPRSDVGLIAGLSIAKALCTRARVQREAEAADFETIDRAVLEIEKQVRGLEDISRYAESIRTGGEKILDRARIIRESIAKQVTLLGERLADLKALLGEHAE